MNNHSMKCLLVGLKTHHAPKSRALLDNFHAQR
jgi:hypothetical protein